MFLKIFILNRKREKRVLNNFSILKKQNNIYLHCMKMKFPISSLMRLKKNN